MLRLAAVVVAAAVVGAGCAADSRGSPEASGPGSSADGPAAGSLDPLAELVRAAQDEGTLTTIGMPPASCNYDELIKGFTAKYGIKVVGLQPDAGPEAVLDALSADSGSGDVTAPDVIDVGLRSGPVAKARGLLQPYRVSTWDTIPDVAKDPDAAWTGDYYHVVSFETNEDVVKDPPEDWVDLLKPEHRGQVALSGDPTKSVEAMAGVWAAAFANGGGADDPAPGLDFFDRLNTAGNLVPIAARTATVTSGRTPIRITWTANGLADQDAESGSTNITVTVPTTGRLGGMNVQAISAGAPHPNAARLWMEYLYSDEGQTTWLAGYCYPIRYDDLASRGAIPTDLVARLPDREGTFLPLPDQAAAADRAISAGWPKTVGVKIRD